MIFSNSGCCDNFSLELSPIYILQILLSKCSIKFVAGQVQVVLVSVLLADKKSKVLFANRSFYMNAYLFYCLQRQ